MNHAFKLTVSVLLRRLIFCNLSHLQLPGCLISAQQCDYTPNDLLPLSALLSEESRGIGSV